MGLRYEDLPEPLRRAVDAQQEKDSPLPKRKTKAYSKEPGLPVRCTSCDEVFTWTSKSGTPAAVTKHQASTGHRRFEAILVDNKGEDGGQRTGGDS